MRSIERRPSGTLHFPRLEVVAGSLEEAEKAAQQLPLRLKNGLTRGQAEDLLALLQRERVAAQLRQS